MNVDVTSTSSLQQEIRKQNGLAAFYSANNKPDLARRAAEKADMAQRGIDALTG